MERWVEQTGSESTKERLGCDIDKQPLASADSNEGSSANNLSLSFSQRMTTDCSRKIHHIGSPQSERCGSHPQQSCSWFSDGLSLCAPSPRCEKRKERSKHHGPGSRSSHPPINPTLTSIPPLLRASDRPPRRDQAALVVQ